MKKERIILDELPKISPFTAPEGYFDALPQRIQARAVTPPSPSPFSISWNWQRTVASLGGISLIALLVWQTLPVKQGALGADALSQISNESIVDYLHNQNLTPFDIEHLTQTSVVEEADADVVQQLDVSDEAIRQQLQLENVREAL